MVTLDKYLADVHARGFRVLEHPDYGGVGGNHMPTSMHFKGRAGDINWGPAGAPLSERDDLIWAAKLADAAGLNVIYAYHRTHPIRRTNDNHRDHLHVDDGPITAYRAPGANYSLYRRILAQRPGPRMRKPHSIATTKKGDKTWRTGLLQRFLKATGDYNGKIDNRFGDGTEKAVKRYQRRADLVADGVVGRKTWYRMVWGVEPGDRGPRVEIAQRMLGLTGKKGVDGIAGKIYTSRSKEVQRWLGVPADAKWGPKSIRELMKKG